MFWGEHMDNPTASASTIEPDTVFETSQDSNAETIRQLVEYAQTSVLVMLAILIVGSTCITLMSLVGFIPWLQIAATLGGHPIPGLGPTVQILFTLFCASLLAFLPASARILKLEKSHRDFNLGLRDIERAYRAAHAEDREGIFTLSDQFEAVRERLAFLRKHPDLAHLEPEILETAAQMSFLSRDLALVYSDDAVARAKSFLAQRQEEITRHRENIAIAVNTAQDLKRWQEDLNADENEARRQIARLEADLMELLPSIKPISDPASATVLPMPRAKSTKPRELADHI